jgi:hypothetical protein
MLVKISGQGTACTFKSGFTMFILLLLSSHMLYIQQAITEQSVMSKLILSTIK